MCIREAGQEYPYTLITDSLHNIYNTVTVIAALRQLGYDHGTIARRMAEVKIPASRLSDEDIGGVKVIMQMSKDKNALACSRNFDYIRSKPGKKELLLMMNCLGVAKNWSENPSWMYDTDFEFLNSDDVTCLVCAGRGPMTTSCGCCWRASPGRRYGWPRTSSPPWSCCR